MEELSAQVAATLGSSTIKGIRALEESLASFERRHGRHPKVDATADETIGHVKSDCAKQITAFELHATEWVDQQVGIAKAELERANDAARELAKAEHELAEAVKSEEQRITEAATKLASRALERREASWKGFLSRSQAAQDQ